VYLLAKLGLRSRFAARALLRLPARPASRSEGMRFGDIDSSDRVAPALYARAAAHVDPTPARAVGVAVAPHQPLGPYFRHDNAVIAVDLDQEVPTRHGVNVQELLVRPRQTHGRDCGAPDGDIIPLLLVVAAVLHPVNQDLEHIRL
jgi:hypothetical protein